MKKTLKFYICALLLSAGMLNSCEEPEVKVTKNAREGGLISPVSAGINYVVGGTSDLDIDLQVLQGPKVSSIDVYKKFYSVAAGAWTNEVLSKTIDVSEATNVTKTITENYASLINGLQLSGAPLPASETDLGIGDFWELRFVSKLQDGNMFESSRKQRITISSRFAGTYIASGHFAHPTSPRDYEDIEKAVSSLSATEYSCDQTGDLGNYPFTFSIALDGTIEVIAGDVNGLPITGSGHVGLDNVNGVDTLYINYEYNASTRVITEKLIKVVD
ncbi:hypothetical protein GXP67_23020 [Rhodocytophaga rosea]|uniref:Uncharacterized protein n=1 Tax=Rhodocytophaga rosea TaxID=2704465 RepID=A0A6C0GNV1_9BACT|nr:hypothetical protein [Rhodocytophaga rosea]QHT69303.1 hypothetical protein GXP67_23020 [Rhodocytophaga rosea]